MASTYLTRTISSAGSETTGTFSAWFKRSAVTGTQYLLHTSESAGNDFKIIFNSTSKLRVIGVNNSSDVMDLTTNRVFRDVGAFYNIVVVFDTTQATEADRVKIYINGVQETSFSTATYPSQNLNLKLNQSGDRRTVGNAYDNGGSPSNGYWDGLMSYVAWIDGTAYDASYFGETNAATGIWKIKTSPSVTYGTNGFFLKMDTSSPGSDTSGNNNTFTASGTPTLAEDNASNNLVTMNPLDNYWMNGTFAYGNTRVTTATTEAGYNTGTIGASSGKFYWEMKLAQPVTSGNYHVVGVASVQPFDTEGLGYREGGYAYQGYDGQIRANGSVSSYGDTWNTNDIIGTAIDVTNKKLYFSKNGVWQNSGDPTSGATGTGAFALTQDDFYFPAVSDHAGGGYTSGIFDFNFGNGFFGVTAVASSNADAAGHGLFEYAVPTGYYTLNTKNLNTYGG